MEFEGGGLLWGVKQSFRDYIAGAEGTTRVDGGAELAEDGRIVFPQTGVDWDGDKPSILRFGGSVEFDAHGGLLSLRLRDPWVEFHDSGAVLSVVHPAFRGPTDRRLVLCALAPVGRELRDDVVGSAQVPTTLTIDGAGTFDNLYPVGTEFDPLTVRALARVQ